MEKIIILTDVTSDLSQELRSHFKINDYVKAHLIINDEEHVSTLDWKNFNEQKFYKFLVNKKNKVTTAPASPDEYFDIFKNYVEDDYKIISISISSVSSTTFNSSCIAAKMIKESYPDASVTCIDSRRLSGGVALLVCYAQELVNNGYKYEDIVNWINENKEKIHQMGPIDDLRVVAKRGHISNGKAFMGNLIGIKPMGDCNKDGYISAFGKVKGINKALDLTVEYIKQIGVDLENQYIIICHSNRKDYANTLKKSIQKQIKCKKVFVNSVFPTNAVNIGEGMICAYFMGDKITDCQRETEIFNKLKN